MAIKQKRFTIVFSGLGDRQRLVAYLPVDDKLDEKTQKIKLRQAAEWAVRKQYKDGNRASIRSVKPYMGGAYDSADSVEAIAAKYGHKLQNDAAADSIGGLKDLVAKAKKKLAAARAKKGDMQARIKASNELTQMMNQLISSRFAVKKEVDAILKEAYDLTGEIDRFTSK